MGMGQGLRRAEARRTIIKLGVPETLADHELEIARTYGEDAALKQDGSYLTIRYADRGRAMGFHVVDWSRVKISRNVAPGVALTTRPGYSRARKPERHQTIQNKKEAAMPRRAQVAEPEPEVEEAGELDYSVYAGKDATPTMEHFGIWIIDEVFGGEFPGKQNEEDAFLDGVRLGGTLRMEFQRSEYWKETREQLKADREAERAEARSTRSAKNGKAEPEEEDEEEAPAAPARRTRGKAPAAAAPARTATRGRSAAAKSDAKPAAPARRGRGKTAEAPF
jgi:hypothetical protein